MSDNEKQFSVGEIAHATGLTVRTLQHYDNIGLLPVSGRTEGGRRYYMEKDLLKLEQIVLYKSIGIPLEVIKEKLTDTQSLQTVQKTLEEQLVLLVKKTDAIHLAMSVVESTLKVVNTGSYPPWEMLANLIRLVDGSSLIDWTNFTFDENLLNILKEHGVGNTLTSATDIYHRMRQMMVTAITLHETCQKPEDPEAQSLAKGWLEMIMSLTDGNETTIAAFANTNENREAWPESDRKLFEAAEPFLEAALGIYIASNNIEIPNSLLGKE
jgi:DNA-binding transcriptional MerR regulator